MKYYDGRDVKNQDQEKEIQYLKAVLKDSNLK